MKTISAIFRDDAFKPLDPVDLPENTRLTVALLDGNELSTDSIAELSQKDKALDFLNNPREVIYSESDGEAV
jgi:predicted DNA-binding antitoxin AbrB/MazE fold protein